MSSAATLTAVRGLRLAASLGLATTLGGCPGPSVSSDASEPADLDAVLALDSPSFPDAPDSSSLPDAADSPLLLDAQTAAPGGSCLPSAVPAGGFTSREVYVETDAPECADTCMVYRLDGDPRPGCMASSGTCADPAAVAERVFCTVPCDPSAGCVAGWTCVAVTGPSSYCVPTAIAEP